jgi:hypothetical protein
MGIQGEKSRDHAGLTEELARLTEEQRAALRFAVFSPMSKEEAKKFDERQERIHELNELLDLKKAI